MVVDTEMRGVRKVKGALAMLCPPQRFNGGNLDIPSNVEASK